MSRREMREHLFCLLFQKEFYDIPEMDEQVLLYFDSLDKSLSDEERNMLAERFYLILEKLPEIDKMLDDISKGWRLNRMGKADLAILRLAVYEMCFDEDIPVGVAINEAVEIAKKYGEDRSSSFINGILGRLAPKNKEDRQEKEDNGDEIIIDGNEE